MIQNGVLVLEDGTEFPGTLFGAPIIIPSSVPALTSLRGYGEVVFNTSMTGYQEILTDPSYYGQLICMTTPHIGNTGFNFDDPESSKIWCSGLIIHELTERPSSWRAQGGLEEYLKQYSIPGISGINTRALTVHLRSQGVLRGVILPIHESSQFQAKAQSLFTTLPAFGGRDLIGEVTTRENYSWPRVPRASSKTHIVAMDFGIKANMLRMFDAMDCSVTVVPANTPASEILSHKPDGVFLSNGPGDPAAAPYAVRTVKSLLGKVPLFGVCMGHQILALALGARTYKLKFGHRGGNQPVMELETQKVEISSHNHGYAVDLSSIPPTVEVTHINLNDKTVEGIRSKEYEAFSVQYHPEACPGPHDSFMLFGRFLKTLKNGE